MVAWIYISYLSLWYFSQLFSYELMDNLNMNISFVCLQYGTTKVVVSNKWSIMK